MGTRCWTVTLFLLLWSGGFMFLCLVQQRGAEYLILYSWLISKGGNRHVDYICRSSSSVFVQFKWTERFSDTALTYWQPLGDIIMPLLSINRFCCQTHSFPILLSTQTAAMLSVSFSATGVNSCAAAVLRKERLGLDWDCPVNSRLWKNTKNECERINSLKSDTEIQTQHPQTMGGRMDEWRNGWIIIS